MYLKFTRANGLPLGNVELVQNAILKVLPETRFSHEPSVAEKAAKFNLLGIELPEILCVNLAKLPPTIKGDCEAPSGDWFLQFIMPASGDVSLPLVMAKGDDPSPEILLNQLATSFGWQLSEYGPRDEK